jgi:hypothetical protein
MNVWPIKIHIINFYEGFFSVAKSVFFCSKKKVYFKQMFRCSINLLNLFKLIKFTINFYKSKQELNLVLVNSAFSWLTWLLRCDFPLFLLHFSSSFFIFLHFHSLFLLHLLTTKKSIQKETDCYSKNLMR